MPKGASVSELKHRLKHWKGGNGFLFRLALPTRRKNDGHPVKLLEHGSVYWVPNSDFARMIAESKLVFIMGMSLEPPVDAVVLDVPKDFKTNGQ